MARTGLLLVQDPVVRAEHGYLFLLYVVLIEELAGETGEPGASQLDAREAWSILQDLPDDSPAGGSSCTRSEPWS